ncbi:hypothetical protein ACFC06_03220 [Nocardia sp. NPDC056064]|uniref:hypothetical protein n=1 Tax=Nocardia sp. NPDC056064 TaxID=3345701 RepID=UPI0035DBAB55
MADNVDRWWEAPGFSEPPPDQQPGTPPGPPGTPPSGANSTVLYDAGQAPQPTTPPGSGQFAQPGFPPPTGEQPGANSTVLYGAGQAPQPTAPPPAGSGQFAQPGFPPPAGDQPGANSTVLYGAGQAPQPMAPPPAGSGQFAQPGFPPPEQPGANSTVLYGAGQVPQPMAPGGSGQFAQPTPGYADPNAPAAYGNPGYQGGYPQQGGQYPQQFGAPYGQQPYGYAQQPPRKSNTGVIVAVVGVVVALVVVVTVAVVVGSKEPDKTTVAAPTTVPTTAPLSGTTTAPVSPGSQGVLIPTYRVAYDVPASWSISSAADTMDFYSITGSISGRGRSYDGENYCPGSAYRGLAGVTTVDETDLATAATEAATIAAEGGYSSSTHHGRTVPTALTTASGVVGQFVEGGGPWAPSAPGCTANAYSVYSFAFKNAAGATLALAILIDRGTTGELPREQARAMIDSLRLV